MKKFKLLIFILLSLYSLSGCAAPALAWKPDGTVSLGSNKINTHLDNTYASFNTNQGLFLAGFKIDKQGINTPYIAYVNTELKLSTWVTNEPVNQFFQYQDKIHAVDMAGFVSIYSIDHWEQQTYALKPLSIVVYSKEMLIACVPAPLQKTDPNRGQCYSITNNWVADINWRTIKPVVCGEYLTAIEDASPARRALQLNLSTGNIIHTKTVTVSVADVCRIF